VTFKGFTFASEVLLARIAGFYGFPAPEAEKEASLADFVRARLPHNPTLGDRIRFEGIELVVRDMSGGQITRIGLELGSGERDLALTSGSSPVTVGGR
jgi:NhaP-type Na+/H+ and K+/H+ antiporter